MTEQQATSELPRQDQSEPVNLQTWCPGLYVLGDHVLEILEEGQAMIVLQDQLDASVTLRQDELYHLLVVLHALFLVDMVNAAIRERHRGDQR